MNYWLNLNRDGVKRALAGMSQEQIAELFEEAQEEQREEAARRQANLSDDPVGTIRLYEDKCGHSVMWVRESDNRWDPWLRDTHGNSVADYDLKWRGFPVVGMMPPAWVAEQEGYQTL